MNARSLGFEDDEADEITRATRRADDLAFLATVRDLRAARDLEALLDLELEIAAAVDHAQKRGELGPDWQLVAVDRAFHFVVGEDHEESRAQEARASREGIQIDDR